MPEHVLLDSANLPSFDKSQLEGRVTGSVDSKIFTILFISIIVIGCLFLYSAFNLQITKGDYYAEKAENNRFESIPIFAERGSVFDRNGKLVVWNENIDNGSETFSKRVYEKSFAMGNMLGYVRYPRKDKNGIYTSEGLEPVGGIEQFYNTTLQGKEGKLYIETDALGNIVSKTTADLPQKGDDVYLTIDIDLQKAVYEAIHKAATESGYIGGVGLIADLQNGDMLVAVTYPDFDSNVMTDRTDVALVQKYLTDSKSYFLNRYTDGLYAPGSIVKPLFALAALQEGIINPEEKILSTGQLNVPNPYQPGKFTVFKDWKAHGYTNVREAIAVSSDVYFYTIGGGVPERKGLGITKLADYADTFGLSATAQGSFFESKTSVIPTPEWKKRVFKGEPWRLGDTYNSSIGQYGFSITPIQALTMMAILGDAGEGKTSVAQFRINKDEPVSYKTLAGKITDISRSYYNEIAEGMRMTVTTGTAQALNFPELKIAGKTGTAQTGLYNQFINSWFVGYWPYTNPRYAMVFLLEKGSATNTKGASVYAREVFEGCRVYICDISNRYSVKPLDTTTLEAPIDTFEHAIE